MISRECTDKERVEASAFVELSLINGKVVKGFYATVFTNMENEVSYEDIYESIVNGIYTDSFIILLNKKLTGTSLPTYIAKKHIVSVVMKDVKTVKRDKNGKKI